MANARVAGTMGRKGTEVVFFDVGGTLVWSEPSADVVFARALGEHGYDVKREEVVRRVGVEGPEFNRPDLVRAFQAAREEFRVLPFPRNRDEQAAYFRRFDVAVLERLEVPAEDALLDTVARRFEEDVTSHVYEDALPTLERLRKVGYRLGVISNATHDLPEGLARLGLAPYFEAVTYSWEIGVEKPDPRIFRTALDRMDVEPRRAVHVGDSYEADVVGAQGVGLTPLLIQRKQDGDTDRLVLRSLEEVLDHLPER